MTIRHKVFAAYSVLKADDVNTYLMNQAAVQIDLESELSSLPASVRIVLVGANGRLYTRDAGNAWRYSGGGVPPTMHMYRVNQSIPSGTDTIIANWIVDVADSSISVATNGTITFNRSGIWTINGTMISDGTVAGSSHVRLIVGSDVVGDSNAQSRTTGFAGAGILRQPLHWTGYAASATTASFVVGQATSNGTAINYSPDFKITQIG